MKLRQMYWDGLDLHPLVSVLGERASAAGFRFLGFLDQVGGSTALWRRPAFLSYEQQLSLQSHLKGDSGFVNAKVHLGLVSVAQSQIEQQLALDECDRRHGFREPGEAEESVLVASVYLNWLAKFWPPRDALAWQVWNRVPSKDAEQVAEHLWQFVSQQGEDFFRLLGDPQQLANCLLAPQLHLPAYRRDHPGLFSARPHEYAAVALTLAGAAEAALDVLDQYRASSARPLGLLRVTPERTRTEACRADRLEAWIRSGAPVPQQIT